MTKDRKTFVVEGRGPFPTDMLKYNRCEYASKGDKLSAEQSIALRRITLRFSHPVLLTAAPYKRHWQMAGWKVLDEGDMV